MRLRILIIAALLSLGICSAAQAQWVQTNGPYGGNHIRCFAVSGSNLFAGTSDFTYSANARGGVFRSTNNGTNWTAVNSGMNYSIIQSLAIGSDGLGGRNVFASTIGGGVFRSSDDGTHWTDVNSGLTGRAVLSLASKSDATGGTSLFAGTRGDGVHLSTNNGTSWTAINSGLPANTVVTALGVNDSNLFAGTSREGVYVSTNNGTRWTHIGLTGQNVTALAFAPNGAGGTNLLAALLYEGVYRSTDGGVSWTEVISTHPTSSGRSFAVISDGIGGTDLFCTRDVDILLSTDYGATWSAINSPGPIVYSLVVAGSSLFAGTSGGVFLSSNSGTGWTAVSSGTDFSVAALVVSGTNLLAGTWGNSVWRRPLSEMITGVDGRHEDSPASFVVEQNYPNPFNPNTTIKFELPKSSLVRLCVYDMLGREVSILVNEWRDAGVHGVNFDGSGLSSGVYLYRLQAGELVQTRKLVLLQ